ncbi:MAG TPA: hypothetical protein VGF67_26385 [Ktedonobacteraceae bacterium]
MVPATPTGRCMVLSLLWLFAPLHRHDAGNAAVNGRCSSVARHLSGRIACSAACVLLAQASSRADV